MKELSWTAGFGENSRKGGGNELIVGDSREGEWEGPARWWKE